jgi:serine protease Do
MKNKSGARIASACAIAGALSTAPFTGLTVAENLGATPEADLSGLGLVLVSAASVDGAGDQGILVIRVVPAGRAADSGVRQGDVILDIGGRSVSTPSDLRKALCEARNNGRRMALTRVKTENRTWFVALPVGKSYFGGCNRLGGEGVASER